MTRTTSRLSAIFAALSITIAACSEHNPVAPVFTGVDPAAPAVGVVTFFNDPTIVDILVSSCDATELPASGERITPAGLVSKVQRVGINGNDTHTLLAASH